MKPSAHYLEKGFTERLHRRDHKGRFAEKLGGAIRTAGKVMDRKTAPPAGVLGSARRGVTPENRERFREAMNSRGRLMDDGIEALDSRGKGTRTFTGPSGSKITVKDRPPLPASFGGKAPKGYRDPSESGMEGGSVERGVSSREIIGAAQANKPGWYNDLHESELGDYEESTLTLLVAKLTEQIEAAPNKDSTRVRFMVDKREMLMDERKRRAGLKKALDDEMWKRGIPWLLLLHDAND